MTILPRHRRPSVAETITRYTFSAARPSLRHTVARFYAVHAEERRLGVWQVTWQGHLLSASGDWDYPPPGDTADEVWTLDHTFTEHEARRLARRAAAGIVFQGVHVTDAR
jgi:hypothetical protein